MPADESEKQFPPTAAAKTQLRSITDTLRDMRLRDPNGPGCVKLSNLGQVTVVSVGSSERGSQRETGWQGLGEISRTANRGRRSCVRTGKGRCASTIAK